MNNTPLMPMATAVWLVENTKISFKQIADFCDLHELEVKGIADGDVAKGIKSFKKGMSTDISDDTSTDAKDNADSKNISNDNSDSEQK